jgi:hypothetical protein
MLFRSAKCRNWPLADAPIVRLRVRYRGHSCRAGSLTRRRVRREVADIEHRITARGRPNARPALLRRTVLMIGDCGSWC